MFVMKTSKLFLHFLLLFLILGTFMNSTSASAFEAYPLVGTSDELSSLVDFSDEVYPPVSATDDTYGISPSALDPDSTYPGTNIRVRVGDVLYSSKALGGSTKIVGHVGIMGPDYRIYHVNPVTDKNQGEGGKRDTIYNYQRRHDPGESIAVYRATHGRNAAYWAQDNYSSVTNYYIPWASWDNFQLKTINPNYCSKFIWQAFYYGNYNTDYIIGYYTPNKEAFVTPSQIIDSDILTYVGSFGSRD